MKHEFSSVGRNYRHTISNNQLAIFVKIIGNYHHTKLPTYSPYYWNYGDGHWLFKGLDGTYFL